MMSKSTIIALLLFVFRQQRVDAFSSFYRGNNAVAGNRSSRRNQALHAFEVISEISVIAAQAQAQGAAAAAAVEAIIPSTTTTTTASAAVETASAAGVMIPLSSSSAISTTTTSSSLSSAINSFFQTQPYLASFLTCSFKASAADILAQTQEEIQELPEESEVESLFTSTTDTVDLSRNMGFLLYGGLYQGMAQNFLYSVVYPNLVGNTDCEDCWDIVATKVLMDNLIFAPFLCLPIAYIFKTAFTSEEPINMNTTFKESLTKYYFDITNNGLLIKYWSIWVPVQFLTFGIIPEHFRVAFVAFVSFFWIFILSTVVSSPSSSEQSSP